MPDTFFFLFRRFWLELKAFVLISVMPTSSEASEASGSTSEEHEEDSNSSPASSDCSDSDSSEGSGDDSPDGQTSDNGGTSDVGETSESVEETSPAVDDGGNSDDGQTSDNRGNSDIGRNAILPKAGGQSVWEICCSPESVITTCAVMLGLCAERVTLETGWDMRRKADGVRAQRQAIKNLVLRAWLALPCTPWTCMQNFNQRTSKQKRKLQRKRKESLRMLEVCLPILQSVVLKNDGHFYFEWPTRCHGWNLQPLREFLQRLRQAGKHIFKIRVDGCAYGLKNKAGTHFLSKSWTILTTDRTMVQTLSRRCSGDHTHATCQGSETSRSAVYPLSMGAVVALTWARSLSST